ncbi:MAG TPA: hypothetical protein VNT20_17615 [Flavisolibacter sp.]|jgi:hypothetical protein|nr:hypothetical protein [Flavisolibacter sp.]
MQSFTRVFMTRDQEALHFHFDCIISPAKKKYQVRVRKKGGEEHHFVMEEKNEHWQIIDAPLPPGWVHKMEGQLDEMICKYSQTPQ